MTLLLLTGLLLVALSGVLTLRVAAFGHLRRRQTLAKIDAYGFTAAPTEAEARGGIRDALGACARLVGERLARRLGPEHERALRALLDSAGFYRVAVATFVGYRALAAVAAPAFVALLAAVGGELSPRAVVGAACLAGFGWVAPKFVLGRRAAHRLEQVDREVPELVDLLVTTVEAGVGFAAALQIAARSIEGPLGQELRLALREQSMGLTIDEALRNMAGRIDSAAIRSFIQALVQGEALGVSIGKVLRDLAVDMRKRRRQAAEERAQKTPTKIVFPLVALILPAMFIVTLGPALMSFFRTLGS